MSPAVRTLAPDAIGWVERCLGPSASVVYTGRLGGITGPWLLRVRRRSGIETVVLRDGDPEAVNERDRFGVEAAALQAADDLQIAAPRLIGHDLSGAVASRLAILSTHLRGHNAVPPTASQERLVALGRAAASLNRTPPNDAGLPKRSRPLADLDFAGERAAGDTTELLQEADDSSPTVRHLPSPTSSSTALPHFRALRLTDPPRPSTGRRVVCRRHCASGGGCWRSGDVG